METSHQINRYPPGSFREMWLVFFPILIATFSNYAVITIDRIIVSHVSLTAVTGVSLTSVNFFLVQTALVTVVLTSEVFIGQFNGAKDFKNLGRMPWQMFWFSLTFLIPVAVGGWLLAPYTLPQEYHSDALGYTQIVFTAVPLSLFWTCFACFYIGRGKNFVVLWASIFTNSINALLDYIFVLGIPGWIPAFGTVGAAYATIIAFSLQTLILMYLFLLPHNRKVYNTADFPFRPKLLLRCLKIAWPNSLSYLLGYSSFVFFIYIFHDEDPLFMSAFLICHSAYLFVFCIVESLSGAAMAVSANYIGSKDLHVVPKSVYSVSKFNLLFAAIMVLPFLVFPDIIASLFIHDSEGLSTDDMNRVIALVRQGLMWFWIIFLFDGFFHIFYGQLASAGDTVFPMVITAVICWFVLALPTYYIVKILHWDAAYAYQIMVLNTSVLAGLLFVRYLSGAWKKKKI